MEARAVKLLTRKVAKAELGYQLVKDVEELIREIRVLGGRSEAMT